MRFFRGLRGKIFLTFAGLAILLGVVLLLFVKVEYARHLRGKLEQRGVSIARHLAQQSIAPLLSHDPLAIKLAATQIQQAEEDIIYIFLLNPRNREVLAHTFGAEFPIELLDVNVVPPRKDHGIVHLETELGPIYDVAVPIGRGGLGQVQVGISGKPIAAAINRLTCEILLATLLLIVVSLLFSLPLSAALARPLGQLSQAAREVAEGRLPQRIPEQGADEIGELARSFNYMTRRLQDAQRELLERNYALSREVTRRKSAENMLASQLGFLETLINELPEPVFYKDTEGIFLGCNRAFEEFYGLTREQIIGNGVHDLFPENEARIHDQADRDLFAHPGACQYEQAVVAAGNQPRQTIYKKTTFVDNAGRVAGLVGVIIDVTAERQIDQLRREFVAATAHEFQTPLAVILSSCELLRLPDDQAPGNRDECLAIIQERAEFLSRLVDQFLDLNRIEAGRDLPLTLAPCHPERLIHQLLRHRNDRRHRFEIRFPKDCPPVLADAERLLQVFENLLDNAVKYSPPQGCVVIAGEVENDLLRISVTDQGVGLAEDQFERIFDKFFKVDTRETAPSGTGIGLYVSRAIVEAHGGRIKAHGRPGQGATITFTLPLATTQANQSPLALAN